MRQAETGLVGRLLAWNRSTRNLQEPRYYVCFVTLDYVSTNRNDFHYARVTREIPSGWHARSLTITISPDSEFCATVCRLQPANMSHCANSPSALFDGLSSGLAVHQVELNFTLCRFWRTLPWWTVDKKLTRPLLPREGTRDANKVLRRLCFARFLLRLHHDPIPREMGRERRTIVWEFSAPKVLLERRQLLFRFALLKWGVGDGLKTHESFWKDRNTNSETFFLVE